MGRVHLNHVKHLPFLFQLMRKKIQKFYAEYFPWFVDFWYYLVIIVVFIVCAVVWL
jgi:hypothetical protein